MKRSLFGFMLTALVSVFSLPFTAFAVTVPEDLAVAHPNYTFQVEVHDWQDGDDITYRHSGSEWQMLLPNDTETIFSATTTLQPGANVIEVLHTRPGGPNDSDSFTVTLADLELLTETITQSAEYVLQVEALASTGTTLAYSLNGSDYNELPRETTTLFSAPITLVDGLNTIEVREFTAASELVRSAEFSVTYLTSTWASSLHFTDEMFALMLESNAYELTGYGLRYRAYSGLIAPDTWTLLEKSPTAQQFASSFDPTAITNGSSMSITIETQVGLTPSLNATDFVPLVTKEYAISSEAFAYSLLSESLVTAETDGDSVPYFFELAVSGLAVDSLADVLIEIAVVPANSDTQPAETDWQVVPISSDMSFGLQLDLTAASDIYMRATTATDEELARAVFTIEYILTGAVLDDPIVMPAVMPHELVQERCQFVDVDFATLFAENEDYYDALLELCDFYGWVQGDDEQVTINGATGHQVRLEDTIARTEFAKLAILGPGQVTESTIDTSLPTGFDDTPSGQWFSGVIRIAREQGWMTGFQDRAGNITGFNPTKSLSYAEATVTLLRVAGVDTVSSCTPGQADELGVSGSEREWMRNAICYTYNNDLLPQSVLLGIDPATTTIPRKDVIYMIYQMLEAGLIPVG